MASRLRTRLPWIALGLLIPGCDDATTTSSTGGASSMSSSSAGPSTTSSDASSSSTGGVVPAGLSAKLEDTHLLTSPAMQAAVELGLAGRALTRLLGRDPARYDGFSATTDVYVDPTRGPMADPLGFALAIEATEASSAAARALTNELGAGVSLEFGGLLNPLGETGEPSATLLRDRIALLAQASRATGMSTPPDLVVVPAPAADPVNPLGFPGVYPVFAEYRGMATDVAPAAGASGTCKIARDPAHAMLAVADHECDATSLHLTSHANQSEEVLAPDALGFSAWNQALFVARSIGAHDANEIRITNVAAADVAQIGATGNTVVGQYPDPTDPTGMTLLPGAAGTYFGVSAIDGFQALLAVQALDEKAHLLLTGLTTTDGTTLAGGTVLQAIDYDYDDPIRWWPASVTVTETETATTPEEASKFFPQPTSLAIGDKKSRLLDLSAVLAGYATVYAMTDAANPAFGGDALLRAVFDGAPFAADNGNPDGESTLHDRALGVLKIALVDLDRLHLDAPHGALVDEATVTAGVPKVGGFITTTTLSTSIVALRTAYRALTHTLLPDANDVPDAMGAPSALDATSVAGAPFTEPLGEHLRTLVRVQADAIRTRLVGATGVMLSGYDVANNLPDLSPTTLAVEASGLRGLVEAWLLLGDAKYLESAKIVYAALEEKFWNPDTRIYRTQIGENTTMTYDPRTLASIVGALRSYRAAIASAPGEEAVAMQIDARLLRVSKVVVNGWNDLDEDGVIDPKECLGAQLLMGERSRTGELGIASDMGDRDHDCLPDVVKSKRPPVFASELVLTKTLL